MRKIQRTKYHFLFIRLPAAYASNSAGVVLKGRCEGPFDFTALRSPVPAALAQAGQALRRSNLVTLLSPRRNYFVALTMTTPRLRTGKVPEESVRPAY